MNHLVVQLYCLVSLLPSQPNHLVLQSLIVLSLGNPRFQVR